MKFILLGKNNRDEKINKNKKKEQNLMEKNWKKNEEGMIKHILLRKK
jgi:hypothetical protein